MDSNLKLKAKPTTGSKKAVKSARVGLNGAVYGVGGANRERSREEGGRNTERIEIRWKTLHEEQAILAEINRLLSACHVQDFLTGFGPRHSSPQLNILCFLSSMPMA